MHTKQIAVIPAHMVILATAKHIGSTDGDGTLLGTLLSGGVENDLVEHRLQTLMFIFAKSWIPTTEIVDDVSRAFYTLGDKLGFRAKNWFKAYMTAIEIQKNLPATTAIALLGLQPIDQTVTTLFEDIETGNADYLPGSDFDKIAPLAFLTATSIVPVARQGVIKLSFEMLSRVSQELKLTGWDEIKTALDALRIRMNPNGEEGTVKTVGKNMFIVLNKTAEPFDTKKDDDQDFDVVTTSSAGHPIGADMAPQPAA